jgi:glyoxylate/hydroxypyruvate reductase
MRITFCCDRMRPEKWQAAFAAVLPQADFSAWQAGDIFADYAVLWHPPAQFFAEQPALKAGFNIGAGVDGILKNPHLPAGLPIIRLEDAGMANQMLEYVLYAVLHYFRCMDDYAAQQIQRLWKGRKVAATAQDFIVGVMGLGEIGRVVAQGLAAHGFTVHGWSRSPKSLAGVQTHAGTAALPGFLGGLDAVASILPNTPGTRGLMNAERLGQLKPGAALINVGRGDLVPTQALLDALDSGHLRGAFLDVFETEPLPAESQLWTHPKVRLTPHISARTLVDESVAQIAEKILRLEQGEPVTGVVDRMKGY